MAKRMGVRSKYGARAEGEEDTMGEGLRSVGRGLTWEEKNVDLVVIRSSGEGRSG